ncbi:uncharacterized protein LOC116408714 [Xenopus tropicalis]|uniref:Uncharacterized protein LOC116408714 n=1 Tax=Xenopus tropicalis TaxID=8364 RepID=A0A8J1J307_XENTR|nr:uncharacterized protein LOC116408714 [Xenopus tropicalis]
MATGKMATISSHVKNLIKKEPLLSITKIMRYSESSEDNSSSSVSSSSSSSSESSSDSGSTSSESPPNVSRINKTLAISSDSKSKIDASPMPGIHNLPVFLSNTRQKQNKRILRKQKQQNLKQKRKPNRSQQVSITRYTNKDDEAGGVPFSPEKLNLAVKGGCLKILEECLLCHIPACKACQRLNEYVDTGSSGVLVPHNKRQRTFTPNDLEKCNVPKPKLENTPLDGWKYAETRSLDFIRNCPKHQNATKNYAKTITEHSEDGQSGPGTTVNNDTFWCSSSGNTSHKTSFAEIQPTKIVIDKHIDNCNRVVRKLKLTQSEDAMKELGAFKYAREEPVKQSYNVMWKHSLKEPSQNINSKYAEDEKRIVQKLGRDNKIPFKDNKTICCYNVPKKRKNDNVFGTTNRDTHLYMSDTNEMEEKVVKAMAKHFTRRDQNKSVKIPRKLESKCINLCQGESKCTANQGIPRVKQMDSIVYKVKKPQTYIIDV